MIFVAMDTGYESVNYKYKLLLKGNHNADVALSENEFET